MDNHIPIFFISVSAYKCWHTSRTTQSQPLGSYVRKKVLAINPIVYKIQFNGCDISCHFPVHRVSHSTKQGS